MKIIGEYQNGNYNVSIYDDGTKVRENELDFFEASFPECMDVKITDYCDMGCPYCHENSTKEGKHGDILSPAFIDTLRPFTEIAIGGGNPLSHPDLDIFLHMLRDRNIIANITVNQKHFEGSIGYIDMLMEKKLVHGVGVSLTKPTPEFIALLKGRSNIVLHVINGIVGLDDLRELYGLGLKVLILGYKEFRKGKIFHSEEVERKKDELYKYMCQVLIGFSYVSFDNLALRQLEVKRLMPKEKWDEFFMGDDGDFTMYIDLVKQEFALCSVAEERYPLFDTIDEMFKQVKGK